jgi:hypothetical protein
MPVSAPVHLASLVDEARANDTFYSGVSPAAEGVVPCADVATLGDAFEANQNVFKSLPMSWWVSNLNSGNVQYFPFSNDVNWAYFPSVEDKEKCFHISVEITNAVIPNRTDTVSRNEVDPDAEPGVRPKMTVVMQPNNFLRLSVTRPM